jgi:hypothetical protein
MIRLKSDERGAIMLVALAFAVFAVAMLYYAVGIAQTVLLREKVQDAADATALTSAVVHARSMNFLVLLNIIMAALVAVLVALKLAETLAIIGIIIAAALAWVTSGATLSAIPPLKVVQQEMRSLYDTTKDPIFTALEVLHTTADTIVPVVPGAAHAVADADLGAFWQPEVQSDGVVFMAESSLPVEDDTFDHLCERGGTLAGNLAMKPLPLPGAIRDTVAEALGGLTGSMSDWFCGDSGGGAPPSPPPRREKMRYPRTELMDRCKNEVLSADDLAQAKLDLDHFSTEACDQSSAETDAAQPDERGRCRSDVDCSESGPYETYAQLARKDCDPTTLPAPFDFRYQTQQGRVTYTYEKKVGWMRGEPTFEEPRLVTSQVPLCGAERSEVSSEYAPIVHQEPGAAPAPLCTNEDAPSLPPLTRDSPTTIVVEFTVVRHVLSCMKWQEEPVKIGDATAANDSDGDKNPKQIKGGVKLGSEAFQTRVFVKTPLSAVPSEGIVKLALWNAKSPDVEKPKGYDLRQYGFAQAEYFYDGTEGATEWMWNMNWRARLRRFRLPEDSTTLGRLWLACATKFENGFSLSTALPAVEDEIAH